METLQRGSVHLLCRAPCHGLCSHHRDACALGCRGRGTASGSRCPSRPLGLSLCSFHHVVGAVVLGGRLWATRGSVPTGLCPGSVVTSRTAPCRAAVVTSCVFSICHSWCCSRLCGVK